MGSELRGDDIAGVWVGEELRNHLIRLGATSIQVFMGGTAPENLTGEIGRFLHGADVRASHIALVDAAEMELKPGRIALLTPEKIGGISFSTHRLPLSILVRYFEEMLHCGVTVVGIQPANTAFGAQPAPAVRKAVDEVVAAFVSVVE